MEEKLYWKTTFNGRLSLINQQVQEEPSSLFAQSIQGLINLTLILKNQFLGSMLPQYMALCVSQLVSLSKKKLCVCSLGLHCGCAPPSVKLCVSICWVTLWVRPPPLCETMCVRRGLNCGCVPPSLCETMCVRSFGYIVGASPPVKICVSVCWVTLWVRPPPL